MVWFGIQGHSLFMRNQGTKTGLHVLQVTSMTNDILVHLNGMNKMGILARMKVFAFIFSGIICKACASHKAYFSYMWLHLEMSIIQSLNNMACMH